MKAKKTLNGRTFTQATSTLSHTPCTQRLVSGRAPQLALSPSSSRQFTERVSEAMSTLTQVNIKTHIRNVNNLCPHYRFHILFGMVCLHVPR